MTEDEMLGWYHQLDGHEFEQALGVGDGPGSLAKCSSWGCKVEFPRETGLILRCAGKAGNPFQTTQSCLTLCNPMNRSTPGLPVHHQLPEFTQTQVQ